MRPQSKTIRTQTPLTDEREHSSPVFLTSSFQFDNAEDMQDAFADRNDHNIYSRFVNPTVQEFIDRMCVLEGAESGFATATGMAAIFGTFMTFLSQGDHIISSPAVFGSTHTILTKYLGRWGISYSYVKLNDIDALEAAITQHTRLIYFETPTNPGLEIFDIAAICAVAKKHGVLVVVDNCFASPVLQQPIALGADLVIHSATKWIDGQGRVLGGIVLGNEELIKEIYLFCRQTGPSLSAFNAWLLSKSLETLELRMERHSASALKLAIALQENTKVNSVKYPLLQNHPQFSIAHKQMNAGGGIVTFDLNSDEAGVNRFLNALEMLTLTSNLGDSRSIASHPASTTHSKLTTEERAEVGITHGLIRISVGLEAVEDIIADILQALDKV